MKKYFLLFCLSITTCTFANNLDSIVKIEFPNSVGTGFFIDEKGLIITNAHVMKETISSGVLPKISNSKGEIIEIESYADCRETIATDLCLVKLKYKPKVFLKFDETLPEPGVRFLTIGHPNGLTFSMAEGIVSNIRSKNDESFKNYALYPDSDMIQLSAAINPGNSGGPVINSVDKVWGIVTWSLVRMGADGINFAIPARRILDYLKTKPVLTNVAELKAKQLIANQKFIELSQKRYETIASKDPNYLAEIKTSTNGDKGFTDFFSHGSGPIPDGRKIKFSLALPLDVEIMKQDGFKSQEEWEKSLIRKPVDGIVIYQPKTLPMAFLSQFKHFETKENIEKKVFKNNKDGYKKMTFDKASFLITPSSKNIHKDSFIKSISVILPTLTGFSLHYLVISYLKTDETPELDKLTNTIMNSIHMHAQFTGAEAAPSLAKTETLVVTDRNTRKTASVELRSIEKLQDAGAEVSCTGGIEECPYLKVSPGYKSKKGRAIYVHSRVPMNAQTSENCNIEKVKEKMTVLNCRPGGLGLVMSQAENPSKKISFKANDLVLEKLSTK